MTPRFYSRRSGRQAARLAVIAAAPALACLVFAASLAAQTPEKPYYGSNMLRMRFPTSMAPAAKAAGEESASEEASAVASAQASMEIIGLTTPEANLSALASAAARPETSAAVKLALPDAINRAVARNKSLASQMMSPGIAKAKVFVQRGTFDTNLSGLAEHQHSVIPSSSKLSGAAVSETDTQFGNVGVAQKGTEGSSLGINFNNQRQQTNSTFTAINPNFQSNLIFNATKPLMKNAGYRVNQANLQIAKNGVDQAFFNLAETTLTTIQAVEKQYWDLVFARQDRQVKRFSVEAAHELLVYNRARERAGLGSDVDVVEADSALSQDKDDLEIANEAVGDAQENLRAQLSMTDVPEGVEIVTSTLPESLPPGVELDAALKTAFERRPDYQSDLLDLRNQHINVYFLKNQKLPELDLVTSFQYNGLAGTYGRTFDQITDGDNQGFVVGLQLTVPLQNHAARGNYKQGILQKRQSLMNLKALEDTIVQQVTAAVRDLSINLRRVDNARRGADLAARDLQAAEERFRQGVIANFDLLRFQQELATARSKAVQSVVAAFKSRVDVEASSGVLLDGLSIDVRALEKAAAADPGLFPRVPGHEHDARW